jgi:lambda family phage tail tape measure protein
MAKEIKVLLTLDTRGFETGIGRATKAVDTLKQRATSASDSISGAFKGLFAGIAAQSVIDYADTYTNLQNRLRAFSVDQAEANSKFKDIQDIAASARTGLEETGKLYTRLSIASRDLGLSQDQVAQITETFAKATQLSGASTAEAAAGMLQFSQAMAAGRLNGDEFRSLMENSPVFMNKLREAVSKATGNSKVNLKELASEGKLTSELLAAAALQMSKDIDTQYGKMGPTIGQSLTQLKNSFISLFGELEANTGIFSAIAGAIQFVADNLSSFLIVLTAAFGPAAIAMVTKFFRTVQALMMRNPFTAIATAIAIVGATLYELTQQTGSFSNALKIMANYGIGAVNTLIQAFRGFFTFMGEILPVLGKAFVNAINPFSDQSTVEMLKNGVVNAFNKAKAVVTAQGPIPLFDVAVPKPEGKKPRDIGNMPVQLGAGKEDKDAKRAAERMENARKKAEEYVQAIRDQIKALNDRTDSELKNIGVGELAKKLEEARLKNQEDLNETLRKINSIENLSAADRNKALTEAQELYKTLGDTAQESLKKIDAAQKAFTQNQELKIIGANAEVARREFEQMMQLDGEFNSAKKERLAERFGIENDFFLQAAKLRGQYKDQNDKELQEDLARLEERKTATLKAFDDLTPEKLKFAETQRSFSYGWEQAYGQWMQSTEDMAGYAQTQFSNLTQGLEDAFTNFVMTGKLSFKSLINSILADIAKLAAKNIVKGIFGSIFGGATNPFASLFGGARAAGGPVQAGKTYLVGERGPEMVRFGRAGYVYPNIAMESGGMGGGSTNVIYNISAVDAPSFKQLVSSDPQFIYSVTQVGGRKAGVR